MKITITRFNTKQITTAKGPATVMNFQDRDSKTWYSTFQGKWNSDWAEGKEIEIADSQLKVTEKDGKTYNNIQAPAGARGGASVDLGPVMAELSLTKAGIKIINENIKALNIKMDKLLKLNNPAYFNPDDPQFKTEETKPQAEESNADEISPEEIPI